jgi:anti-sigma regulatory factor (Ser/Thr protein kinase)
MSALTANLLETFTSTPELQRSDQNASKDIFLCNKPSEEAFLFTLDNAPYFLYETANHSLPQKADAAFTHAESFDALFMLTNQTCFSAPVCQWMSNALAKHYRLTRALTQRIHTAMHEALSNAVIHGNLNVHGRYKNIQDFEAYYAHIHSRLVMAKHRDQRVTIAVTRCYGSLTVHISDEGHGYYQARYPKLTTEPLMAERGLAVIRELCPVVTTLRAGSTIQLHFTVS